MAYGFNYRAYLVHNGKIEYIDSPHTLTTSRNLVEYWKKYCPESFYCKKGNCPEKYAEQEREYWEEEKRWHEAHPETELDANELPW